MPVRSIITNPANGDQACRPAPRRSSCAAPPGPATSRCARSMSRPTSAPPGPRAKLDKPKNKYDWQRWTATVKLPSDGYYEIWTRGDRLEGHDAAAHRRQLESARLRRQPDAPGRGAGGLMSMTKALAAAGSRWPPSCCSAVPRRAQAPQFVPRDENPEDFPAGTGRDDTFYACTACHGFKLVAQQGMNRRQWEDSLQLDDRQARHAAVAGEGPEGRARLSRGDLSAARAGHQPGLAEPVRCHANRATANSACGPVRGVALWRANAREFGGGRPINRSKRLNCRCRIHRSGAGTR